jgi:hypothetical protein
MTDTDWDFDVTFDFATDTRDGKDPDADSATLRRYNRMLWSKPLESGEVLALEAPKVRSHGYLVYTAPGGDKMWFSSDAITHSYTHSTRPKALVTAKAALTSDQQARYLNKPYTIGSAMIWPVKRRPPMGINSARGMRWSSIGDRMDLTLECIRRLYSDGHGGPLADTLTYYDDFFSMFEGFREFVDFFHFQDLTTDDYTQVKFFLPLENFTRPATPRTVEEYVTYREGTLTFIAQRERRMSAWVSAQGK